MINADLKIDGIHVLDPSPLSQKQAFDIKKYLMEQAVWDRHVCAKSENPSATFAEAIEHRWPVFSPTMEAIITAPHFFEVALSFFPHAQRYFGEFPRLYSMNAFWTQPAGDGHVYMDTQAWHRDGDDQHQFTIFGFGTDVETMADGGHLYQIGTHHIPDDQLSYPFREDPPVGEAKIKPIVGPAGTLFIVDTNGLHKALKPTTNPRLLIWARWGTANPPRSYEWDSLKPVPKEKLGNRYPDDPALQEAIKLVVY